MAHYIKGAIYMYKTPSSLVVSIKVTVNEKTWHARQAKSVDDDVQSSTDRQNTPYLFSCCPQSKFAYTKIRKCLKMLKMVGSDDLSDEESNTSLRKMTSMERKELFETLGYSQSALTADKDLDIPYLTVDFCKKQVPEDPELALEAKNRPLHVYDVMIFAHILNVRSDEFIYMAKWKHDDEWLWVECLQKSPLSKEVIQKELECFRMTRENQFFLKMITAFQTLAGYYIVTPYQGRCCLNYITGVRGSLNVISTMFYIMEIVYALVYLHEMDIILRNLNSKTVMLDRDGHIFISDFSMAALGLVASAKDFDTVPVSYMAPELINHETYYKSIDWWALGIICYTLLYGQGPFDDANPFKTICSILKKEPVYSYKLSGSKVILFCKALLVKHPERRLGSGARGSFNVINHPCLRTVDWVRLASRQYVPPFVPPENFQLMKGCSDDMPLNLATSETSLADWQIAENRDMLKDISLSDNLPFGRENNHRNHLQRLRRLSLLQSTRRSITQPKNVHRQSFLVESLKELESVVRRQDVQRRRLSNDSNSPEAVGTRSRRPSLAYSFSSQMTGVGGARSRTKQASDSKTSGLSVGGPEISFSIIPQGLLNKKAVRAREMVMDEMKRVAKEMSHVPNKAQIVNTNSSNVSNICVGGVLGEPEITQVAKDSDHDARETDRSWNTNSSNAESPCNSEAQCDPVNASSSTPDYGHGVCLLHVVFDRTPDNKITERIVYDRRKCITCDQNNSALNDTVASDAVDVDSEDDHNTVDTFSVSGELKKESGVSDEADTLARSIESISETNYKMQNSVGYSTNEPQRKGGDTCTVPGDIFYSRKPHYEITENCRPVEAVDSPMSNIQVSSPSRGREVCAKIIDPPAECGDEWAAINSALDTSSHSEGADSLHGSFLDYVTSRMSSDPDRKQGLLDDRRGRNSCPEEGVHQGRYAFGHLSQDNVDQVRDFPGEKYFSSCNRDALLLQGILTAPNEETKHRHKFGAGDVLKKSDSARKMGLLKRLIFSSKLLNKQSSCESELLTTSPRQHPMSGRKMFNLLRFRRQSCAEEKLFEINERSGTADTLFERLEEGRSDIAEKCFERVEEGRSDIAEKLFVRVEEGRSEITDKWFERVEEGRSDIAEKLFVRVEEGRSDIAEKLFVRVEEGRSEITDKLFERVEEGRSDIAEKLFVRVEEGRSDIADKLFERVEEGRSDIAEKWFERVEEGRSDIAEKLFVRVEEGRSDIAEKLFVRVEEGRSEITDKLFERVEKGRSDIAERTEERSGTAEKLFERKEESLVQQMNLDKTPTDRRECHISDDSVDWQTDTDLSSCGQSAPTDFIGFNCFLTAESLRDKSLVLNQTEESKHEAENDISDLKEEKVNPVIRENGGQSDAQVDSGHSQANENMNQSGASEDTGHPNESSDRSKNGDNANKIATDGHKSCDVAGQSSVHVQDIQIVLDVTSESASFVTADSEYDLTAYTAADCHLSDTTLDNSGDAAFDGAGHSACEAHETAVEQPSCAPETRKGEVTKEGIVGPIREAKKTSQFVNGGEWENPNLDPGSNGQILPRTLSRDLGIDEINQPGNMSSQGEKKVNDPTTASTYNDRSQEEGENSLLNCSVKYEISSDASLVQGTGENDDLPMAEECGRVVHFKNEEVNLTQDKTSDLISEGKSSPRTRHEINSAQLSSSAACVGERAPVQPKPKGPPLTSPAEEAPTRTAGSRHRQLMMELDEITPCTDGDIWRRSDGRSTGRLRQMSSGVSIHQSYDDVSTHDRVPCVGDELEVVGTLTIECLHPPVDGLIFKTKFEQS
ncbi:hypothetical protein Btru_071545 [Bulinus truncatus]|nr:hypothetical protein Btru_071545 [Bulinus truncatus]